MSYLEVFVGAVVITDQSQTICTDRDRCVTTHVAWVALPVSTYSATNLARRGVRKVDGIQEDYLNDSDRPLKESTEVDRH